ncbi:hypothetical protein LCGC14_0893280 [marine sediment metagenome]|uniref:Uncharacterized protein n=1 Tax=marine sediment metagenome TaxID=412755 RepID=A0A0F9NYM1_9ZZZZ
MSSDTQPFNSLGQILSQGGEQALAKAIFAGFTSERIILLFARLFEPMLPADRVALRALSNNMVNAGAAIGQLEPPDEVGPAMIPVNQYLYGDEPGGRRVRVAFDVQLEGFERLVSIVEDFPDIPTLEDLREAARREVERRAFDTPGAFGVQPGAMPNMLALIIPFTERRF